MFRMTPNIFKNFLTEKATRLYPFEVRRPYADARGEIVNHIETCNFCGICAAKCPSQCIAVDKKTATWTYAPFVCVCCGICVEVCPKKSISQGEIYRKPAKAKAPVQLTGTVKPETPDTPRGAEDDNRSAAASLTTRKDFQTPTRSSRDKKPPAEE